MNEAEARDAVLVRAIELADTTHVLWPRPDRERATEAARAHHGKHTLNARTGTREAAAFVAHRAAFACERLKQGHQALAVARRAMQWPAWLWWSLPVVAFALGLASNALGPDRLVNIISFPLLAILAWNVLAYVLMIATAVRGFAHGERPVPALAKLHARFGRRGVLRDTDRSPMRRALVDYAGEWLRLSSPLNAARARTALHVSAALFAAGAVAGMYVRGLGLEYLAGWESTFLTEQAVHRLLVVVLGPASVLSGIAIPGPEHLATLRWPPTQPGESAARWIHLYALTASLFVVLPRAVLAALNAAAVWRRRRNFSLPLERDFYFRRLIATAFGKPIQVRAIPYAYTPDARAGEALRNALADSLDGPVAMELLPPVRYGDEDEYIARNAEADGAAADCIVLLFSLAATPEDENHGAFAAGVRERFSDRGGAPRVLGVIDMAPYRQRLAGQAGATTRLNERRDAWQRMLRVRGIPAAAVDLNSDDTRPAADEIAGVLREHATAESSS
jgi:hypothetical protein